jgi:hypothetical protein
MKPKIAYLVDESEEWEGPIWKFYAEDQLPNYIDASRWSDNSTLKRIVYWEIEETE